MERYPVISVVRALLSLGGWGATAIAAIMIVVGIVGLTQSNDSMAVAQGWFQIVSGVLLAISALVAVAIAEAISVIVNIEVNTRGLQPTVQLVRPRGDASPLEGSSKVGQASIVPLDVVYFVLLPTIILIGAHYFLIIQIDVDLVWSRAASILLAAQFGLILVRRLGWRWFPILGMSIAVGIAAVLGMSVMVHLTDGDPILPQGRVAWRETLQYVISIALAYLVGSLLVQVVQPVSQGRVKVIQIAGLALTALASIYLGFKGVAFF